MTTKSTINPGATTMKMDHNLKRLRALARPGSTIYVKCNHVSRSGMYRVLDLYAIKGKQPYRLSGLIASTLGAKYDRRHDGLAIGGCGMDMGFAAVYDLSQALYGKGYKCRGQGKCGSNYHTNHRRADGPESFSLTHTDGYALKHQWL